MSLRKYKKLWWLSIPVGLTLIGGTIGLIGNIRVVKENSDVNEYRNYDYSAMYSSNTYNTEYLAIFPQSLDNLTINEYSFMKVRKQWHYNDFCVYLDVTYTEEEYQKELDRLSGWSSVFEIEDEQYTSGFLYDENCKYFSYPTYIAVYGDYAPRGAFEYALLAGENRIIYVRINGIEKDEMRIDEAFLPKEYYDILDSRWKLFADIEIKYTIYNYFGNVLDIEWHGNQD